MNDRARTVLLVLLGAVLLGISVWIGLLWARPDESASPQASITLAPTTNQLTWERAVESQEFTFPADHGPHPGYQTEWWYYTGNLEAASGRRFAYQLTFFRRGLAPRESGLDSQLAMQSLYFAHFAITDVEAGDHEEWERFARGAGGLAGGQSEPFRVWLEDWSAEALDQRGEIVHLKAHTEDVAIDLELRAGKPVVLHGEAGLSPKSEERGNASYYLSFTRMQTSGALDIGGQEYQVDGLSWFDHEWSTSALGEGAEGWDWFSLQMDDDSELMLFQIRNQDGTLEPVSSGTFVRSDGSWETLTLEHFEIESLGRWTSDESGIEYPSGWRIVAPDLGFDLIVEPLLLDQEVNLSFVYWEGAVEIAGQVEGRAVEGYGFVELTGYGESMQGTF